MDISNFKDELFKKALSKGFECCEIYYIKSDSFSVNIFQEKIYQYKNSYSQGLSFRGIYKGNMCYSYTEKIDNSVYDLLIENAIINGDIIEEKELEELFFQKCDYAKINEYEENLNFVTPNEKIDMAKKMETIGENADSRVKSVNSSVVGNGESELYIANTLGLSLHSKSNLAYAYCYVNVEENQQVKVAIEKWIGRDFKDLDVDKLAKKAVEKAVESLGAAPIASGKYPVIFKNECACDLLAIFTSSFFGEVVEKGFSKLKGKLNTKIGSNILNIHDDAIVEGRLTNSSFDSEGVPTKNKIVVENGILKTFLYNTKSGKKSGVASTGNGYKPSFKSSLSTGTTNFYVEPSSCDFDDLLAQMENGVLITELSGLHAGVNGISGDFSLSLNGFCVENGIITKAIEQVTVAGNFFEMLMNIKNIGSDLKFDFPSDLGSIGSPSLLVEGLVISGV